MTEYHKLLEVEARELWRMVYAAVTSRSVSPEYSAAYTAEQAVKDYLHAWKEEEVT